MEDNISTSAWTIRPPHPPFPEFPPHPRTPGNTSTSTGVSLPSSPRSSTLPSPPDSPSSGSVSSLPSVSSSFFFSSAAASPGPSQPQSRHGHEHEHEHESESESEHGRESTHGLVIPSLVLPAAVGRPTAYGRTVGDVRLLVLGSKGAGRAFVAGLLLEGNEDVVDVGTWEDVECGRLLRASTDWVEHRDAHGLERFEPMRNVEILDLPGYDHDTDMNEFLQTVKSIIQIPFYTISDVLDPTHRPSAVVANLVAASSTPLYTALIFLLPSPPTALDTHIIDTLSTHIPTILLPRIPNHQPSPLRAQLQLSAFRPSSTLALRTGLFRSPETLAALRCEAADRFLRWREVERSVDEARMARRDARAGAGADEGGAARWDEKRWEAEWAGGLSWDVARRLREGALTERSVRWASDDTECMRTRGDGDASRACVGMGVGVGGGGAYDPLHLPSLVVFSISLLGPLRARVGRGVVGVWEALGEGGVRVALAMGGFCVGVGVGSVWGALAWA